MLGDYRDLKSILEDINLSVLNNIGMSNGGDCFNIIFKTGKNSFDIVDPQNEIKLPALANNKFGVVLSDEEFSVLLSMIFSENGLRYRCDEDIIGLYDSTTTLHISSDKLLVDNLDTDDYVIEIYTNYMFKGQRLSTSYDILFLIDNIDKNVCNNIEQIQFIMNKCNCYTYLYTDKIEEELDRLVFDDNLYEIQPL